MGGLKMLFRNELAIRLLSRKHRMKVYLLPFSGTLMELHLPIGGPLEYTTLRILTPPSSSYFEDPKKPLRNTASNFKPTPDPLNTPHFCYTVTASNPPLFHWRVHPKLLTDLLSKINQANKFWSEGFFKIPKKISRSPNKNTTHSTLGI